MFRVALGFRCLLVCSVLETKQNHDDAYRLEQLFTEKAGTPREIQLAIPCQNPEIVLLRLYIIFAGVML